MDDFVAELRRREADFRRDLETLYREQDLIAKKIQEHEQLLEHVRALLRAELGESYEPTAARPLFGNREVDWTRLTVREAIQRLLSERDRAMHANDIREDLERRGMVFSRKDPKATIVTALVRGAGRGIFVRTAPNTYRLKALDEGGEA